MTMYFCGFIVGCLLSTLTYWFYRKRLQRERRWTTNEVKRAFYDKFVGVECNGCYGEYLFPKETGPDTAIKINQDLYLEMETGFVTTTPGRLLVARAHKDAGDNDSMVHAVLVDSREARSAESEWQDFLKHLVVFDKRGSYHP